VNCAEPSLFSSISPKGGISIVEDGEAVHGAQMQVAEHVAGREAGDQEVFGVVAGRIATKAGIA
jgi:hypothetical protein